MYVYWVLYDNQSSACALIGQSAMVKYVDKLVEKSHVFCKSNRLRVSMIFG